MEAERREELGRLERLNQGLLGEDQRDSLSELSLCDNHPADIATETFERSKDIGLKDRGRVQLSKIDEALASISDGTYGTCAQCGARIPEERLESVPDTRTCISCQQARDSQDRARIRPVEEQVIAMPFGGVPGGDNSENNMYDGKDSWEDVAGYGTSSDTVSHDENENVQEAGDSVDKIPYRRSRDGILYQDLLGRDDERPPGGPV